MASSRARLRRSRASASKLGNVMPRCQSAVWTSFSATSEPSLSSALRVACVSSNHERHVDDRLAARRRITALVGALSPALISAVIARLEPSELDVERLELLLSPLDQPFDARSTLGAGRPGAIPLRALD